MRYALALAMLVVATVANAGFWDPHMANGAIRTEFPSGYGIGSNYVSLWYTDPTLSGAEGCLFNAAEAFTKCEGRRPQGTPFIGNQWPTLIQAREACGGNTSAVGDSWLGCLSYSTNTYFSLNSPSSNYWVIHANTDPSFDQCRDGSPGQSYNIVDPIANPTTPNLYKVAMEYNVSGRYTMNLVVSPSEHYNNGKFYCSGLGAYQYQINYLSGGAHNSKGNGGPIGYVHPSGGTGSDHLNFKGQIRGYQAAFCQTSGICNVPGAQAGILMRATWDGIPHLLYLLLHAEGSLLNQDKQKSKWNWPLSDSMYYPGGEIAVLDASSASSTCGFPISTLPTGSPGTQNTYSLDMSALFNCASTWSLFSTPMPSSNTAIESVDWFIEFSSTGGMLWMGIEDPEIVGGGVCAGSALALGN